MQMIWHRLSSALAWLLGHPSLQLDMLAETNVRGAGGGLRGAAFGVPAGGLAVGGFCTPPHACGGGSPSHRLPARRGVGPDGIAARRSLRARCNWIMGWSALNRLGGVGGVGGACCCRGSVGLWGRGRGRQLALGVPRKRHVLCDHLLQGWLVAAPGRVRTAGRALLARLQGPRSAAAGVSLFILIRAGLFGRLGGGAVSSCAGDHSRRRCAGGLGGSSGAADWCGWLLLLPLLRAAQA